jgi:hypothetical protein
MLVANYIILFIILISLGVLYQKYIEKQSNKNSFNDSDLYPNAIRNSTSLLNFSIIYDIAGLLFI